MDSAPKVGDRVRCTHEFGICVGVVEKIHKTALYDDPQFGWKPESEWKVTLRPDKRPDWWAWGANTRFCPDVSTLEPIEG